ncbi:AMP-binding protein [Nocardioidaceae bacterium]|nr:AMP-binding protein [Nocardioidaceae bacterium]
MTSTAFPWSTSRPALGVPLARDLRRFGGRPALVHGGGSTTYAELADAVERRRGHLGERKLVLLEAGHDLDTVVTYLAALAGGHPVLLTEPGRPGAISDLVEAWDPDVLVGPGIAPDGEPCVRREATRHDLHPDLALLLSTSGSTGSSKLVRLSAAAVQSNAEAIADRLGIRGDDVAATTLPLHYCFGLSVLHTHLLRGATVWLTDLGVVDPCFWEGARRHGLTSLSGVPHTFTMLERVGFPRQAPDTLRTLAQAGGRMAPATVRDWAEIGADHGMDLVVMYGQTEATARMATLDPALVVEHPDVIGTPLDGGRFSLRDVEERDGETVGELVYSGPNVMMGYAEHPGDLSRGHEIERLRTGDLARRTPEGLWQIVGRRKRIAKVMGLRVDLDRVQQRLADSLGDRDLLVVDLDEEIGVLLAGAEGGRPASPQRLASEAAELAGVPPSAVVVTVIDELPLLATGKPDLVGAAALVRTRRPSAPDAGSLGTPGVAGAYATVLGRTPEPTESFVDLGGDSLSFVEVSVRLEALLGELPGDWHLRAVGELEQLARGAASAAHPSGWRAHLRLRTLDTSVMLRALAILAIVGTHAGLFSVRAGAHVLMAVVGYNVARFVLSRGADPRRRLAGLLRAARRVAVPSVAYLGALAVVGGGLAWHTVTLTTAWFGPEGWVAPDWRYWFVEALVACLVVALAVTAVTTWAPLRRWERDHPFGFAVALVLVGMPTHLELIVWHERAIFHRVEYVWWLFALGWAAARAVDARRRLVVSGLVLFAGTQFFDSPARTWTMIAGLLLLVWARQVRVPAAVVPLVATLASASLWIYLTHWQVYPPLEATSPALAVVASCVVGVAAWRVWETGARAVHERSLIPASRKAHARG